MQNISVRPAKETDLSFIYATMLRSLYYSVPFYKEIDKKAFFVNYSKVVQQLLQKPGTEIAIACFADEPDIILGYAITEPVNAVGHFAYVKAPWRAKGIFKQLLENKQINVITHLTSSTKNYMIKNNWTFNPFMI